MAPIVSLPVWLKSLSAPRPVLDTPLPAFETVLVPSRIAPSAVLDAFLPAAETAPVPFLTVLPTELETGAE